MPVVNCPIDIPEGWEFVRYGTPISGETFLNEDGEPESSDSGRVYPWVIIRRVAHELAVGDWVRVCKKNDYHCGRIAKVEQCDGRGNSLVSCNGEKVCWFDNKWLTKQTRTIEPYTMDQMISEAAKRGLHVQCGSKSPLIESVHIAGVTLSCPSIGFVSYVEAAKSLTWSGGEAFGNVTWRDAE